MKQQEMFKCTIMRGGTSKAVFLKKNELPQDEALRDKVILAIFGSPDVRQIDGLGGSDITTSKVAIIGPSSRDDADVDYNFGQVQLNSEEIIWNANCGNISSAVGPYAIDEGFIKVTEPFTTVRIHNVNTQKVLVATIAVKDGCALIDGDYKVDGVPGTGSKIELDYKYTFGAVTGKLLPTGNVVDILDVEGVGKIPASIVDIANSVCFVKAESVGVKGWEGTPEIKGNNELMSKLEAIREAAALKCGFIKPGEKAIEASPIQPLISFVSPSVDYQDYASGNTIKKEDVDFLARVLFNQLPTDTFPGTATICAAVASQIKGTVVNQVMAVKQKQEGFVAFGHARGVNNVEVSVDNTLEGPVVQKAIFCRTARRILDGYVYVRKSRVGI